MCRNTSRSAGKQINGVKQGPNTVEGLRNLEKNEIQINRKNKFMLKKYYVTKKIASINFIWVQVLLNSETPRAELGVID